MQLYEPQTGKCVARTVFDDQGRAQDAVWRACASNTNMPRLAAISRILLVILVFFGIG
jgi:hypothetical protein